MSIEEDPEESEDKSNKTESSDNVILPLKFDKDKVNEKSTMFNQNSTEILCDSSNKDKISDIRFCSVVD